MLTSNNQKVSVQDMESLECPYGDVATPGHRQHLTLSGTRAERGKPVSRPSGRLIARNADRGAGKGGRKKRKLARNGPDRGSSFAPTRKGADFRRVSNREKTCRTGETEVGKMTGAQATAATFGHGKAWHDIDWAKANQVVRRLQARIAKAVQGRDWRRAKRLQRFLTGSLSGRACAVRRVIENRGKKTPGVDGETWNTPESKTRAIRSLNKRGYQPLPLRRVYIPKANGKRRPLGIPTMKDRAMQALYLQALEPIAETTADPNSYGFRKNRGTKDATQQLFICLAMKKSPKWILDADITGCFDHISHDWLIANTPMDKEILRKWLKAGFVEKRRLFPTEAGTPQGGIISPTLANITLNGMEKALRERFGKTERARKQAQLNIVRYADDFVITGRTEGHLKEAKEVVTEFLKERGLSLSPEKTRIAHIDEGFEFLGWNFRKYKGVLLIKPADKNVSDHVREIRSIIKEMQSAKQEDLIGRLNPIIRGWVNYYSNHVSKNTFGKVDHLTWLGLWKWARRRHPNKGRRWIKDRYFHTRGLRRWIFGAKKETKAGGKLHTLAKHADTPIRRHVKIKAEANPFDPKWETYFEERAVRLMKKSLFGRAKILWNGQDGTCPNCQQPITIDQEWVIHHKRPISLGGGETLDNLQMLHGNCHRQLHAKYELDELPVL